MPLPLRRRRLLLPKKHELILDCLDFSFPYDSCSGGGEVAQVLGASNLERHQDQARTSTFYFPLS